MIIQLLLSAILPFLFFVFSLLSSVIPDVVLPTDKMQGISYFLSVANALLPQGFLVSFLTSIAFWKSASLTWAIIEFIYKKIPFINIS